MDGTWYQFYQFEGHNVKIDKLYPMTIISDELVYEKKVYNLDYKEGVARVKANEGEMAKFSYKDGVVIFFMKKIKVKKELLFSPIVNSNATNRLIFYSEFL